MRQPSLSVTIPSGALPPSLKPGPNEYGPNPQEVPQ
jgi:hypothetical protein